MGKHFEDYTLGKKISSQQAAEIDTIAAKHGFKLSGVHSFEKNLTAEQVEEP
jgi:fatty aldehyde-generating acyl-ACP reductase